MSTADFTITPEGTPTALVLHLRGELDIVSGDLLTAAIDQHLAQDGTPNVHLVLTELTFLDSSGLRALLSARQSLLDHGARLTMSGATGAVAHVIDVTQLGTALGLQD